MTMNFDLVSWLVVVVGRGSSTCRTILMTCRRDVNTSDRRDDDLHISHDVTTSSVTSLDALSDTVAYKSPGAQRGVT